MADKYTTVTILSGEIVEQSEPLTLSELCRQYAVHAEWIIDLVDEGILEPQGEQQMQWRFPGESCRRAEGAAHLSLGFQEKFIGGFNFTGKAGIPVPHIFHQIHHKIYNCRMHF